jgi:hypothetical protein
VVLCGVCGEKEEGIEGQCPFYLGCAAHRAPWSAWEKEGAAARDWTRGAVALRV